MALFTPRGLKVRLSREYAFALMARVYPKADAFRVLQLTEEVDNLPVLSGFIAAIAAFSLRLPPIQIGIAIFATTFLFRLIHLRGMFWPPVTLLLPISRVYSFVSGYGVLFVALMILGFFTTGWKGIAAYAIARLSCFSLFWVMELIWMRKTYQKLGSALTTSERSFFHAFRLLATRYGASTDLQVSELELAEANWVLVYRDLALKWPVVVSRFTDDT